MSRIKQLFQTTRFKRGTYSSGLTVLVLAIAIVFNLVVQQLPENLTTIDLTENGLYTLGDQTKEILGNLDEDITIYHVVQSGNELEMITKILNQYAALSGRIKVKQLDPVVNPVQLKEYDASNLSENSLIVESGKRFKTVSYSDIVEVDYSDYYTYGSDPYYSFDGEGEITSAIDYVMTDDLPKMYIVTGHGEQSLPYALTSSLEKNNIETEDLTLMAQDAVPEDCDVLAVMAPSTDYTEEETGLIRSYLEQGGKLLAVCNYTENDMANLYGLLSEYGLDIGQGIVMELGKNNYTQHPVYLLPELASQQITTPIVNENMLVLTPYALPMTVQEELREGLTVEKLLTTTTDSFASADYDLQKTEKGSEDAQGPFTVGAAVTNETENGTAQLVVYSTFYPFLSDYLQITPANADLFVNSVSWMCGQKSTVEIYAKSIGTTSNTVPAATTNFWTIIFVAALPAGILAAGFAVWIRRRRK